jgi:hypothetical protein
MSEIVPVSPLSAQNDALRERNNLLEQELAETKSKKSTSILFIYTILRIDARSPH